MSLANDRLVDLALTEAERCGMLLVPGIESQDAVFVTLVTTRLPALAGGIMFAMLRKIESATEDRQETVAEASDKQAAEA